MAFIAAMEKFLAQKIGGRYQEDVSDNIQTIIDHVTVDVNTLEMPVIMSDTIRTAANPEVHFGDINLKCLYNIDIKIQDQNFTFDIVREIESGNNEIKIVDASESPMGNMTDMTLLD
ncbi:MAG: hypothetical protein KJO50_01680, partial [Bacteroidia bacterium]|nr:hypothetical protein [Bacteroidia bacterium]